LSGYEEEDEEDESGIWYRNKDIFYIEALYNFIIWKAYLNIIREFTNILAGNIYE
jgi:hypothetical protein